MAQDSGWRSAAERTLENSFETLGRLEDTCGRLLLAEAVVEMTPGSATVLEEETIRIQRWDQAREWLFQTQRALRMLQVVNTQIAQSFHLLAMHMLPGSPGDDMRHEGRVVWDQLSPQSVPEDDKYHETDGDLKEGESEEGED